MGLFSKIKEGLKKTRDSVVGQIDSMLKSFTKIDDELFEELEELLVMGDVGVNTAQRICEELKSRVKQNGVKDPGEIMGMLHGVVREMLEGDVSLHLGTKPSIILVIGVNGVGKTTTIGKIASRLTKEGKKVVIAAADTFRAAAIDQLAIWAERSGSETAGCRLSGEKISGFFRKNLEIRIFCLPLHSQSSNAEIAQLVERNLAKVEVAGPSPVFRSRGGQKGTR